MEKAANSSRHNLMDDISNYLVERPARSTRNQNPHYNLNALPAEMKGAWRNLARPPYSIKPAEGGSKSHIHLSHQNHLTERRHEFILAFLNDASSDPQKYFQDRDNRSSPTAEETFRVLRRELLKKMRTERSRWDNDLGSEDLTGWLKEGDLGTVMKATVETCTLYAVQNGTSMEVVESPDTPVLVSSSFDTPRELPASWEDNAMDTSWDATPIPSCSPEITEAMEEGGDETPVSSSCSPNVLVETLQNQPVEGIVREPELPDENMPPPLFDPVVEEFLREAMSEYSMQTGYVDVVEGDNNRELLPDFYNFINSCVED